MHALSMAFVHSSHRGVCTVYMAQAREGFALVPTAHTVHALPHCKCSKCSHCISCTLLSSLTALDGVSYRSVCPSVSATYSALDGAFKAKDGDAWLTLMFRHAVVCTLTKNDARTVL